MSDMHVGNMCHVFFLEFVVCLRVLSMTPCWCCRVRATQTPIHLSDPSKSAYVDKGASRYQAKDLAELVFFLQLTVRASPTNGNHS